MGTNYYEAFKNLHSQRKLPQKKCVKIGENVFLLGKELDHHDMSDGEVQVLSSYEYKSIKYKAYSRLLYHNIKIHCCTWNPRHQKRSNHTISYSLNNESLEHRIIQKFLLLEFPEQNFRAVAIVAKLVKHHSSQMRNIPHLDVCLPLSKNAEIVIVPIENIHSPGVYMLFSDKTDYLYVAAFVNLLGKD